MEKDRKGRRDKIKTLGAPQTGNLGEKGVNMIFFRIMTQSR